MLNGKKTWRPTHKNFCWPCVVVQRADVNVKEKTHWKNRKLLGPIDQFFIIIWDFFSHMKGTVRPDLIYMRVVLLIGTEKDINRYRFLIFFTFTLEYLKRLRSSEWLHAKMYQTSCLFGSQLHRILSSYWLAHFYLMKKPPKCCSILVWIVGCWNSLLTSFNPEDNWCLSRIFGARFSGMIAVWSHANRDPNK